MYSSVKDMPGYIFAILTFKCLKSVTTLSSLVTFLLINITGLKYAENHSFNTPK